MEGALRVAFADFSAAPRQGFEKSERGPNNSSLFLPQAAVVVVAVRILSGAQKKPRHRKVCRGFLVRPGGFEPLAFRVGAERSIQLSYDRKLH